jgi:hypothetical protein
MGIAQSYSTCPQRVARHGCVAGRLAHVNLTVPEKTIDRRSVLRLFGTAAAGATGIPALAASALGEPALDLSRADDFLAAVLKLRGSVDDRLCMGWVIGTRYAVIDHAAIPMMGILAGTFSRYRKIRDDAYAARSIEVAYFTDLATGKLLETWKNPVTGKTVEVPQIRMGPASLIVTARGLEVERPSGEAAGMELRHRFEPAVTRGDDVWITEIINVDGQPSRPGAKEFVYNEMSTYHGKLSALADPRQATVPTSVNFHGLVTWRPWMGFGDLPGHTTAHGAGTRAARIEDMPEYYLELTERYHADVLNDPLGILDDPK